MHPNPAYRTASTAQNLSFARERGFGVLTIGGADGPLASHIPFVLSADDATFGAHVVRSNPIAGLLEGEGVSALMIISGPDAYISPDWYGLDDQVPTWNYVAVHLRGTLRRLPDQLRWTSSTDTIIHYRSSEYLTRGSCDVCGSVVPCLSEESEYSSQSFSSSISWPMLRIWLSLRTSAILCLRIRQAASTGSISWRGVMQISRFSSSVIPV